jgi:hypothetical protein
MDNPGESNEILEAAMEARRILLSLVLAGGSLWCLGLVRQVHSEEKAAVGADKFTPITTLPLLTESQEEEFGEIKKSAEAGTPKFKDIQARANYIAELFNVKQYVEKADGKAAAAGRDQALELAKVAKAKDRDGITKLLAPIEEAIKKTSKPGDAASAPPGPYKPVSPIKPLMEAQQDLFDDMNKALDAPKEDDFKKIEKNARLLAELSNVNRHQKEGKEDYVKWATQARDQSLQLAKAAGAKDVEGAKTILKRELKATCAACHDKYQ